MGECISISGPSNSNTIQQKIENWFQGNEYFDSIAYQRSIDLSDHHSFQRLLIKAWSDVDISIYNQEVRFSYNNQANKYYRYDIHKGIPNCLVKDVIRSIVSYDQVIALATYRNLKECVNQPIPTFKKPCFLTQKGNLAFEELIQAFRIALREQEICQQLVRLTQLLLWFFKDYEVYSIVGILTSESRLRAQNNPLTQFFPTSQEFKREIVQIVINASNVQTENQEKLKMLVKDMMGSLLIGYLSPGYYPVILGYFISNGISGIMKLTAAFLQLSTPQNLQLLNLQDSAVMMKQWQRTVDYDLPKLLKSAFKIKLGPS